MTTFSSDDGSHLIKQNKINPHLSIAILLEKKIVNHPPERKCFVLSATNRFDPDCEPHLDDVLSQESIHCS